MKLLNTVIVFDQGGISSSEGWKTAHKAYASAIRDMDHPLGTKIFRIRPKERKLNAKGRPTSQWHRNGVNPIKAQFQDRMRRLPQWKAEHPLSLDQHIEQTTGISWMTYPDLVPLPDKLHSSVGDLDFWGIADGQRIAIEWETGNISSSHRSVNKLCLALLAGLLDVCVLIVPSRNFYQHLTDRIGNWQELGPYLAFWRNIGELGVKRGLLAISIVEHDELVTNDSEFPFIPMGSDGRSAEGKRKRKLRSQRLLNS